MIETVARVSASACAITLGLAVVLVIARADGPPEGVTMAGGLAVAALGAGSVVCGVMLMFRGRR